MGDAEWGVEGLPPGCGESGPIRSATEAGPPRLEPLRRTIGRDDDLLVDLVQRVEGVEELFLRPVLSGKELDVVDEQHVYRAVLVPELAHSRGGDGADHLVGELLGRQLDDAIAL